MSIGLARLVQLGIRQSRYFGRAKTLFQLYLAATVANLTLVAAKAGMTGETGSHPISGSVLVTRTVNSAAITGTAWPWQIWTLTLLPSALLPHYPLRNKGFPSEFLVRHVGALQENTQRGLEELATVARLLIGVPATRYNLSMIRSFHHRGLRRLFETRRPQQGRRRPIGSDHSRPSRPRCRQQAERRRSAGVQTASPQGVTWKNCGALRFRATGGSRSGLKMATRTTSI